VLFEVIAPIPTVEAIGAVEHLAIESLTMIFVVERSLAVSVFVVELASFVSREINLGTKA
jgi:hypothetical protein